MKNPQCLEASDIKQWMCPTDSFASNDDQRTGLENVERHLKDCVRCSLLLDTLIQEDSLAIAIRAQNHQWHQDETLDTVIQKVLDATRRSDSSSFDDAMAVLSPPDVPGDLGKLGGYRISEVLGIGGMGFVFEAIDPLLERSVAIKVMQRDLARTPTAKSRFLREAQAVASLEHDNIVAVHSVETIDDLPAIVMPLLRGQSLSDLIRAESRLDQHTTIQIAKQIASGLLHAHEHGLVHRDIKPSNIWLEAVTDRVKILDFGLTQVDGADESLTQTGAHLGTPRYMSPEQFAGEPIDHRSDLFSLGVVLYQMLSGTLPFKGTNTFKLMQAVLEDTPVKLCDIVAPVDDRLSDLVHRLLEKDRENRFPNSRDVIEELDRISRSFSPSALDRSRSTGNEISVHSDDTASLSFSISTEPLSEVADDTVSFPSSNKHASVLWQKGLGIFLGLAALLAITIVIKQRTTIEIRSSADPKASSDANHSDTPPQMEASLPVQTELSPSEISVLAAPTAEGLTVPFTPQEARAAQEEWSTKLQQPVSMETPSQISVRLIPPGRFAMGVGRSSTDLANLFNLEPNQLSRFSVDSMESQLAVLISKPFYVSTHETSVLEFRRFVQATDYVTDAEKLKRKQEAFDFRDGVIKMRANRTWEDHDYDQEDSDPVVFVSWNDAYQYCEWLTKQDQDMSYRLPTFAEAEWFRRAGSAALFHFGDSINELSKHENVSDLFSSKMIPSHFSTTPIPTNDGYFFPASTAKTKRHVPNAFGIADTSGNVTEWCLDGAAPLNSAEELVDPRSSVENRRRSVAGGDWVQSNPIYSITGIRLAYQDDWASVRQGFRIIALLKNDKRFADED